MDRELRIRKAVLEGRGFKPKVLVISIPAAPQQYRGHGSAVSLQLIAVGTRHCRVLLPCPPLISFR